ncbi:MAG: hypothetical protein PSX71_10125 [bacterium]|nr:hypothetical protein [bacterium]
MSIGMVLEETMSGWIKIQAGASKQPFSFTIRAFSKNPLAVTAPREFRGVATIGTDTMPVRGSLTILLTGPRYELDLDHPELGTLHIAGEKTYSLSGLLASLTTCPLTVYRDGKVCGSAEVAYRDSMLSFPFKAIKFVGRDRAFGPY